VNIWIDNVNQWQAGTEQQVAYYWGMDYYYEGAWVEGMAMRIYGPIATSYLQSDRFMTVWNVTWYYKGVALKSGTVATYPYAASTADTSANTNMFVDIWFNKMNASTLMGARVASEYYPMKDSSNAWFRWATGSTWGVDATHPQQKGGFKELKDSSNKDFSSKNLMFMRIWENITQGNNVHVAQMVVWNQVVDANAFEMGGIDSPLNPTVKTPNMPQGGFFGGILSAIQGVFNAIGEAGGRAILALWDVFVNSIDNVFSTFGWKNGFTQILAVLNAVFGMLVDGIYTLIAIMTFAVDVFIRTFIQIFDIFMIAIGTLATIITQINFMWNEISPYWSWAPEVAVQLLPLFFVFYLLWVLAPTIDGGDIHGTVQRIEDTVGLMWRIINGLIQIIDFAIDTAYRLIEIIPVVE